MNILILNDVSDKNIITEEFKREFIKVLEANNYEFKVHDLKKDEIHNCIGCFNCWLKTPGTCVFDDKGREVCKDIISSNFVVFITPMKYGCYSTSIKRVIDRSIPNMLPYFKKVKGEIHHRARYKKYPNLIMVGCSDDINEYEIETFKSLANANAINFQKSAASTYIVKSIDDIRVSIDKIVDSKVFSN
jgi:multimeric flavodoxin WrbA